MDSFIPDQVSTDQLEERLTATDYEYPDLPEWDGTYNTAWEIGLKQIDSLPEKYYQSGAHIASLAIKAIDNLRSLYEAHARENMGKDPAASQAAHDLSIEVRAIQTLLLSVTKARVETGDS